MLALRALTQSSLRMVSAASSHSHVPRVRVRVSLVVPTQSMLRAHHTVHTPLAQLASSTLEVYAAPSNVLHLHLARVSLLVTAYLALTMLRCRQVLLVQSSVMLPTSTKVM